jgi:hypothetical protein
MEYRVTVETIDSKGRKRTYTYVRDRSKTYRPDPFEDALVVLEQETREYEDVPPFFRNKDHSLVRRLWCEESLKAGRPVSSAEIIGP